MVSLDLSEAAGRRVSGAVVELLVWQALRSGAVAYPPLVSDLEVEMKFPHYHFEAWPSPVIDVSKPCEHEFCPRSDSSVYVVPAVGPIGVLVGEALESIPEVEDDGSK